MAPELIAGAPGGGGVPFSFALLLSQARPRNRSVAQRTLSNAARRAPNQGGSGNGTTEDPNLPGTAVGRAGEDTLLLCCTGRSGGWFIQSNRDVGRGAGLVSSGIWPLTT